MSGISVRDTRAVWSQPAPIPTDAPSLTGSSLLDAILHARGIADATAAEAFLEPTSATLADPVLLPDMQRAVSMIRAAIARGERITVFGDYDVDGLTSTAMLVRVLRKLGADPACLVPHRVHDGYGVTPRAVERILDTRPELVITVDCGSSSPAEFAALASNGIQAVVLDHHHYTGSLPTEVAFVSTRRPDNDYPCTELAAVGVAFTLVRALIGDDAAAMYLPYVALGTVADVVELLGENRTLVARGIAMLRRWKLPGIIALCAAAGIDQSAVGTFEIGYVLGPRLNAAGRVDSPQIALDLLLADDAATATPLALRLSELNTLRQMETRRIQQDAESILASMGGGSQMPAIVLAGENWTSGIAGLVASRIAETYNRPTVILDRGASMSRGSARSAGVVDIVEALKASSDILDRFGGHSAAAGLSIANEHIATLQHQLSATVFDMCGGQLPPRQIRIDAEASQSDLHLGTVRELNRLEPFGRGNDEPCLLLRNLGHRWCKRSRDGRHLLFSAVDDHGRTHSAVFFGSGDRLQELCDTSRIDLAACLKRDDWEGRSRLKLHVTDFRPAMD